MEQLKQLDKRYCLNRIDFICRSIRQDVSSSEIQQRILSIPEKKDDAIGFMSVDNVKRVVQFFSFVKDITETVKNSHEDTVDKYDLTISLDNKNIDLVGIQVKSSIKAVTKFYKKIDNDFIKVKENLIDRKLIVINGQLPDDVIKNSFIEQLQTIEQYHQNN